MCIRRHCRPRARLRCKAARQWWEGCCGRSARRGEHRRKNYRVAPSNGGGASETLLKGNAAFFVVNGRHAPAPLFLMYKSRLLRSEIYFELPARRVKEF